jgi:2-haloacid dehalogenase
MPLAEAVVEMDDQAPHLVDTYRVYLKRFPLTVSGPVPGTAEVIRDLLAAGVPCFGLSNWAKENFNIARRANPVIDELTDVIVSGEVGLAKPDPEIFRYALERFDLDPDQTVMVDDTQENLTSATRVGLTTVLFTDAEQLRSDLARLQVL